MKLKGSLSVRLFAYLCGKKLQENKEKDASSTLAIVHGVNMLLCARSWKMLL